MRQADYPDARKRWQDWIEKVTIQVSNLLWDEHYFHLSLKAAEKGGYIEPANEVYQLFVRMYVVYARMAIRRLVDTDDGTFSLRALLQKMAANPQVIARDWFVRSYPQIMADTAQHEFDELAGAGAASLPASVPQTMLDELDRAVTRITHETDQVIAHWDRKHPSPPPLASFKEIMDATKVIDLVATRTHYILTQSGSNSCAPGNLDEYDADCWHVWAGRVRDKFVE